MTSLEEATGRLRAKQREAISNAADNADGMEHVDDLAFVSQLLIELMDVYQQTPVGWAVVTAHKALLKMAQNEGVIPRPPRVARTFRSKWDEMDAERCRFRDNAKALDQALVTERRRHDQEVYELRLEISKLNQAVADERDQARAMAEQMLLRLRKPAPLLTPIGRDIVRGVAALWRRLRGRP